MIDLSTTYLGLRLRTPLVASASPLSQEIDGIRHLEDAGASAVVLYSLFEEQLIKEAAQTILHLCRNGIQVFIATHSLFLMRELDILLQSHPFQDTSARYIGLQAGDDGVIVQQGSSIDDIGAITALDEQLSQSDRYLGVER